MIDRLVAACVLFGERVLSPALLLLVATKAATILLVLVLASVATRLTGKAVGRLLAPRLGAPGFEEKLARSKTLIPLLRSMARYVIYFVAGVAILQQVGIDATAVLASAGVVGIAVGFGAQTLVKDLISGFFLLFEGLIAVGDVITVGAHTGEVEAIGIRTTQLRKLNGELWMIPNGEISHFGQLRRGYGRAAVNVPMPYELDSEALLRTIEDAALEWARANEGLALERPQVEGPIDLAPACTARVSVKVPPGQQAPAEQSLRRALKRALDAAGIPPPYPRQVSYVHPRQEGSPEGSPQGESKGAAAGER
ncbi:MAG: mechanosensitive ion channel family protein [Deltaproteobacteria bacterium]|nr:mechanosensitive ion channel family protein [Deltaproteobacteria bacterium]